MKNHHYIQRYNKFIETIRSLGTRNFDNVYTEVHHILPRCLKGSDKDSNLIRLTLREHFLAHWLLWKAYPNFLPLASAFLQMNNKNEKSGKGYQGRLTGRVYEQLRSEVYRKVRDYTIDKVRVRDENNNIITLTSKEYADQDQYKFHTAGKVYVLDTTTNKWIYITSDVYHENKERYKARLSLSIDCRIFLDIETNEILKITQTEARKLNDEYGYKRLKNVQKKSLPCIDANGKKYLLKIEDYDPKSHKHQLADTLIVHDQLTNTKISIRLSDYQLDPNRYLTSTKGKVLVRDDNGKSKLVTKEEYVTGNYVGHTQGLTTVLNKITNQYQQISVEEFNQNKEKYAGPCAGKVNAINKLTGERKQMPKEAFDKEIWVSLGNKIFLFSCRNKLTNKVKNVNIYEWEFVKDQYEILDMDKFVRASKLK